MEIRCLYSVIILNKFEIIPKIIPSWYIDQTNYELWKNAMLCLRDKKALHEKILAEYIHSEVTNIHQKEKLLSRLSQVVNSEVYPPDNLAECFQEYYKAEKMKQFIRLHSSGIPVETAYKNFIEIGKEIQKNLESTFGECLEDSMKEYCQMLHDIETGKVNLEDVNKNIIQLHDPMLKNIFGYHLNPWPIVICSHPRMHKTSLMANLNVEIDKQRLPGLIFSWEDPTERYRNKFLGIKYDIPCNDINNYQIPKDKIDQIYQSGNRSPKIYVVHKRCDVLKFREIVDRYINIYGIRYIIIDYFQKFRFDKRFHTQELEECSNEIVDITQEYKIPVIITALRNDKEEGIPDLNSIKWCNQLAADARQLFFLLGDPDSPDRKVYRAKNTFGGNAFINITFKRENQRIIHMEEDNG